MANPMRKELIKDLCESTAKSEICDKKTIDFCQSAKGDCGFCTITADYLLKQGWKKIPVNVGDVVYIPVNKLNAIVKKKVKSFSVSGPQHQDVYVRVGYGEKSCTKLLGEEAFLTEDEAAKVFTTGFHGGGEHDGKVIHCPNCDTPLLVRFGRASCFRCKWSASDAELDEIMEGEVDNND